MGRRLQLMLLLIPAVLMALLALPVTPVTSSGMISIYGADSGSHMYLSVSGDHLHIHGYMSSTEPSGCQFTKFRSDATCSLDGVDSIEVTMGPGSDKVEIQNPLPVALTAYLGLGSDKLISNNEADTCYPQGTRRNRCLTGGGDDVCITGPRNSDCVGGPGNDYCRASTGSDGCWGGSGDDVCIMGGGNDGCHGEAGDDRLYGGGWSDKLYGGPAADKLYGGSGTDYCDGQGPTGKDYDCETGPRH